MRRRFSCNARGLPLVIQRNTRDWSQLQRAKSNPKKSNQLEAPDKAPPIRFLALILAEVCVRKVL